MSLDWLDVGAILFGAVLGTVAGPGGVLAGAFAGWVAVRKHAAALAE